MHYAKLYLLLSFLLFLYISRFECTICDGAYSCNQTSVYCDSGTDCVCNGEYSCDHSSIYCNQIEEDCFVTCNGVRSCRDAYLYCNNTGYECHVNCIGDNSCNRLTIHGQNASLLRINTSVPTNDLGCQLCLTDIKCPYNGICDIECKAGKSICKEAKIDASLSESLYIKCEQRMIDTTYPQMTCGGMEVYCPLNGNANDCIIEGDPVTNPNNIENLNIYSQNGFDGVTIIGTKSVSQSLGHIYCGNNYGSECVISDHQNNKCNSTQIDTCDAKTSTTTTIISTLTPTLTPTINPTNKPTQILITDIEESTQKLGLTFEYILVLIVAVFVIIAIIGTIDARCLRINDFYRISAIVASALQILDLLSDCFFAIDINLRNKTNGEYTLVVIICIICIVLPSLLSLFQVYYYSTKIWIKDNKIRKWLLKYSKILYLTSIFTGSSFTAITMMNSNLLGFPYFEMNLSNRQIIAFKTQRMYSIIMLENMPQLAIQIWYMIKFGNTNNIIAISSAIFSGVSIIVTVLSMTMEKTIIKCEQYTAITIDITGKSVVEKSKQSKKRVKKIQQGISTIIGLDFSLIEILKPTHIPNGLQVEIHLYIDNDESKYNQYQNLLNDAKLDGSLAQCVHNCWNLSSVPNISTIESIQVTSNNVNGGQKGKLITGIVSNHSINEMINTNVVEVSNDKQQII